MSRRPRMRLAPEGGRIIALSAFLVIVAVAFSLLREEGGALWLPAVTSVWFLLVVRFFRDPAINSPTGENLILSPATGKVVSVGEAVDSPLNPSGIRISIFMSLADVHVNRAPVRGVVRNSLHTSGRFVSALKPKASRVNENLMTKMDTVFGEIAFKQVAGLLARRIVFHPKPGDRLAAGERVGMIRFGSRVDLFLPDSVNLGVRLGDKVVAGETVIGEFPNV